MTISNVDMHTAARRQFVLVVDSDPRNLQYTSALLQRFKYNVWTAWNGAEALEIAAIVMPALIVTAQFLKDMSGLDLIRKLRSNEFARSLSIIVLASKTDPANEKACLAAGAVTCLPAPVPIEDLYRVVQVSIEPVPRMNIRINTKLPVSINNRVTECEDGNLCAQVLSENGAYIRTEKPYPLNTRFPVRIDLRGNLFAAEAVVIYAHKPGNKTMYQPGMGLQFVKISSQDQQRIRLFIRSELTKGIDRMTPR